MGSGHTTTSVTNGVGTHAFVGAFCAAVLGRCDSALAVVLGNDLAAMGFREGIDVALAKPRIICVATCGDYPTELKIDIGLCVARGPLPGGENSALNDFSALPRPTAGKAAYSYSSRRR